MAEFENPFRPGAGHQPPYLAGRNAEKQEFTKLSTQTVILENLVLTGLRGVGKTVLLENFKPIAIQNNWLWVGTDLSESATLSEERIALRLLTDIAVATSSITIGNRTVQGFGFTGQSETIPETITFDLLKVIYESTPGLVHDKLKQVLQIVGQAVQQQNYKGIMFAYDEAQNLSDQSERDEFPLSLLLDIFQSVQKSGLPMMLVFTGLPTLFPTLVESRTFAERMFRVMFLKRLDKEAAREAIMKPLENIDHPLRLDKHSVETIIEQSGGYPYFIQFICREVYDIFLRQLERDQQCRVPVDDIIRKLDTDFFSGRWARATDRQRELLKVIASLPNSDQEFSVQDIVSQSKQHHFKSFSSSHANQMLVTLAKSGLVFKNRYGRYSFAVPLLGSFIQRQTDD